MSKTNSDFNNKVWKENNFVYFIIADKVNDIEAKRLKDTGTKLVEEIMKQTGLKSSVMIDIEKASYFSAKARNDWVEFLKLPNIRKTAIYGGNVILKGIANIIISIVGMPHIQYFNSEAEAKKFLSN